jgi:methylglutamate dehydrogenase subunit D
MRDAGLQFRSPLADVAKPGRHGRADGPPGVVIIEKSNAAIAIIIARRDRAADVVAALTRATGIAVVDGPRRVASPTLAIAGISPGQWIAIGHQARAGAFAAEVNATLDGLAAVTDQSDSRIALVISGPRARDALAKGIPIDLDASAFPPGHVANTAAAHIGLQIASIDAGIDAGSDTGPTFELLVPQSYATSIWSWLTSSAAEYGYEVRA